MHRFAIAIAVGLSAASCGQSPPIATANDAARANVALADLERGRTLLLTRCGSCHVAPLPTDVVPGDWPREVAAMAARAKIDVAQRQLIEVYLVTMARR